MKGITLILIAAIILAFVVQLAVPDVTDAFALQDVAAQPWTLVTSMFLHGSLNHLLGNIFALLIFGLLLENEVGSKRFLIIYMVGGIVAGIASSFFYASSLGASGAIFAVIGALAVMKPKMTVFAYGVPMPMIVAALFWLMLDIAGVFYPTNIANMAHIAGLAFGAVVGFAIWQKKPKEPKHEKKARTISNEDFNQWEEEWM
ncbi:MAG: rhomboid family intramembrane serine protease [Candidatus Aenigmarchaeota archaeon]|nr:rhomboid family intramembrane serine protease [Candidatus Aenigmarchaeota archaeon]